MPRCASEEGRRAALPILSCMTLVWAFSACTGPSAEARTEAMGPDAEAVMETREALHDALNRDDVDAIMAGLTDDHVTMPPDEPVIPDLEALRRWHETRVAAVEYEGSLHSEELVMLGDWALDRWSAEINARSRADGSPVEDVAKGFWIWRRGSDGQWKLARSIWNSDRSASGTGPMSASSRAATEREVLAANDRLFEASARVDLDAVLPMIHDDATFLLNGASLTTAQAKDLMREEWPGLGAQRFDMGARTVAVLSPDAAVVSGSGTLTRIDTEGAIVGSWPYAYSVLWVRQDGRWLWHDSHQSLGPEDG